MKISKAFLNPDIDQVDVRICTNCIYDERVAQIQFDQYGVCNYCRQVENLKIEFGTGKMKGERHLEKIVEKIKKSAKGKKYDCIVGVSGGTDSSYLLHIVSEWGLRPLAVHYDNTWNSAIATMNIHSITSALDVDLYTHVVSNKEVDDIYRAFLLAGVAEIDAATDLGFAYLLRIVAKKFSIKYIFEGHSFIEEGITPITNNYFDGRYIKSIHRQFGELPIKTYPLMTFGRFMWSILSSRVKFIRPLWYINYSKDDAKKLLSEKYGWRDYGGHHLENRFTAFYHSIYLPKKFSTDLRNNALSAQVRNGKLSRSEAWKRYNFPQLSEGGLEKYVKKRLGISDAFFNELMERPPRYWKEFPTYKRLFESFGPIFLLLAKLELVPMSFYLKYCQREEIKS